MINAFKRALDEYERQASSGFRTQGHQRDVPDCRIEIEAARASVRWDCDINEHGDMGTAMDKLVTAFEVKSGVGLRSFRYFIHSL